MADLSRPDEKPAVSPEALLRSLRVSAPGSGLDWEARARLTIQGADYSGAVGGIPIPEGAIDETATLSAIGLFSAFEVIAGPRGCWLWVRLAAQNARLARFDSLALATPPITVNSVFPFAWQINGGVSAVIQEGTVPVAGVGWSYGTTAAGGIIVLTPQSGMLWLPPGGVARWSHTVTNSPLQPSVIVREPLSAP